MPSSLLQHRYTRLQEELMDLQVHPEWLLRHLMALGASHPPLPEEKKQPVLLIRGCLSRVWLYPHFKNGPLYFYGDSDADLTRGLLSLAITLFSGLTPEEILRGPVPTSQALGLDTLLSTQRQGGLEAIVVAIQGHARSFIS